MALNVANLGPGNYVLGGPGRRQGPSAAEAMDLAQREEQRFRDAQRAARETEQRMALAQSQEARAQQQFQAQQAARAQAAAQSTREQAALAALTQGLAGVGGTRPAGVAIPPVAPPSTGLTPPVRTGPALSFGAPVAETADASFAGLRNIEFVQGALPAEPQRMFMTPESMGVRAGLAQATTLPPALGSRAEAAQRDMQIADTQRQIAALDSQIAAITDALTAPGSRADVAASTRVIQNLAAQRDALRAQLVPSIAPAIEARTLTGEEGPGATGLAPPLPRGTPQPPSKEAAAAEAPATPEEAAPTRETPWGGLQLNFGTPVQLSFGEFDGRGSEAYVAAPERIFQDAELAARQQQRLQLLATYYQQTNNLQGLVGVLNQLDELTIEQRYLDGMTAIVGIQQENFGPVQALLQQRYPGRQVEVQPYTDGTVEIFLDGQSEARLTWDDLATGLRGSYDRGFIEQQQALATEAASRSRFLFEQETTEMLRGAREIAVVNSQAEVNRLEGAGRIERIGETASGEVIFQTVVDGVPVQFVYRETTTRDPGTGAEITQLIATPVEQSLVR